MLEQLGFKSTPTALRAAFPDEFGGQLSDEKVDRSTSARWSGSPTATAR